MSRFLTEKYKNLEPYVPGEQPQDMEYVKLNTNEAPHPPTPNAFAAITQLAVDRLRLYPDPNSSSLKKALSKRYGLAEENIFVGNGSDELLAFIFMAYGDSAKGLIFPDISYGFYPVYADLFRVNKSIIPLREDFSLDLEEFKQKKGNVIIANPNAPTGICIGLDSIESLLLAHKDDVVIVDEAYIDFGGESALPLLERYDNLLIVQTFSKSRALAGGRLGFAMGSKELIDDLERIKYSFNSYNVNRITELLGVVALEDDEYFRKNCLEIASTREWTVESLRAMGFYILPSKANFIMAMPPKLTGKEYYLGLKARGILVRYFDKERLYPFVRITIGSKEQMQKLLDATAELI